MAATGVGAAKERKNASLDFIGNPVARPTSRPPSLGLVRLEYGQVGPGWGPRNSSSWEGGALPVPIGRLASARAQLPPKRATRLRVFAIPDVPYPA